MSIYSPVLGNSVRIRSDVGAVVVEQDDGDGDGFAEVARLGDNRSAQSWFLARLFARALVRVTESDSAAAMAWAEQRASEWVDYEHGKRDTLPR